MEVEKEKTEKDDLKSIKITIKEEKANKDEPTPTVIEEVSPPDGGWGWVVTISSFFINVIIIGTHNCFGILYMDLQEEFKESLSITAGVGSITFGCILLFAPLSGALANKYGCRKVTLMGVFIAAVFLFLSSYATSITMLYFTYGFGCGSGASLSYMQGAVMVARYFTTKRALASSIGLAGSTLGTLVMAPFYNFVERCWDWRSAIRVISGITMMTLVCAATYKPLRKPGSSTAEERIKSSPARKFVLDLSLWKNKAFVVWAVAVGLCKLGYLVPWVHMVKFAKDIDQTNEFGSRLIRYMGVTATISRLIIGKLVDSPMVNRLYVSQFSAFMMGVVNILQSFNTSKSGLITYAVALGVLDGGVEILLPVMTLDLVGAEKLSIAWGSILAVISLSSIGPPVAGAIRDATGTYKGAYYFAGIPMILSAFVLILIPTWAQKQHQIPETSILSINPSHLEIIADGNSPVFSPHLPAKCQRAFTRIEGRMSRKKKKKSKKGFQGQLITGKEQPQKVASLKDSKKDLFNKQFVLPGT